MENYLGMTLETGRPKYAVVYTPLNCSVNYEGGRFMQAGLSFYTRHHTCGLFLWYLLIHDTVSHIYILRNTAIYDGLDFYVDQEACLQNKCVMLPNEIKKL
jgi:hypothetical protein